MPAEPNAAQTIQTCSESWNSWWPFRPAWVSPFHMLAATIVTLTAQGCNMPATPLCAGPLTGQVVAAEQSANGSSDLATPTGAPSHKMLLPWEAQPAPMTPAALHREQMQVKCAVTALPRAKAEPRLCAEAFAQVHPLAAPLPDHICVRPLLPDFGVLSLARSICAFSNFLLSRLINNLPLAAVVKAAIIQLANT